jgi:hypothetical protein
MQNAGCSASADSLATGILTQAIFRCTRCVCPQQVISFYITSFPPNLRVLEIGQVDCIHRLPASIVELKLNCEWPQFDFNTVYEHTARFRKLHLVKISKLCLATLTRLWMNWTHLDVLVLSQCEEMLLAHDLPPNLTTLCAPFSRRLPFRRPECEVVTMNRFDDFLFRE